jgi:hypothetical protein
MLSPSVTAFQGVLNVRLQEVFQLLYPLGQCLVLGGQWGIRKVVDAPAAQFGSLLTAFQGVLTMRTLSQ